MQGTTANADMSMQSAILYGMSQSSDRIGQEVDMQCPSDNCTWSAFSSLAVCSKCNDLRSHVEREDLVDAMPLMMELDGNLPPYLGNLTEFRTRNGLRINNPNGEKSSVLMTVSGGADPSKTITFKSLDTLVWAMTSLKVNDPKALWPPDDVVATECAL